MLEFQRSEFTLFHPVQCEHFPRTVRLYLFIHFGGLTFQITAEGRGHSTGNLTVYILKMRDEVAKMIKEG